MAASPAFNKSRGRQFDRHAAGANEKRSRSLFISRGVKPCRNLHLRTYYIISNIPQFRRIYSYVLNFSIIKLSYCIKNSCKIKYKLNTNYKEPSSHLLIRFNIAIYNSDVDIVEFI